LEHPPNFFLKISIQFKNPKNIAKKLCNKKSYKKFTISEKISRENTTNKSNVASGKAFKVLPSTILDQSRHATPSQGQVRSELPLVDP
jgi:hypothetical protein